MFKAFKKPPMTIASLLPENLPYRLELRYLDFGDSQGFELCQISATRMSSPGYFVNLHPDVPVYNTPDFSGAGPRSHILARRHGTLSLTGLEPYLHMVNALVLGTDTFLHTKIHNSREGGSLTLWSDGDVTPGVDEAAVHLVPDDPETPRVVMLARVYQGLFNDSTYCRPSLQPITRYTLYVSINDHAAAQEFLNSFS